MEEDKNGFWGLTNEYDRITRRLISSGKNETFLYVLGEEWNMTMAAIDWLNSKYMARKGSKCSVIIMASSLTISIETALGFILNQK